MPNAKDRNHHRRSWRILTVRGVDLRLHISLLILLVYVILVASAQFPLVLREAGLDPSAISGGPVTWGILFSVALLVSVALHEFGHVLMAQSLGVKVRGITLMMLGGMSEMERMPEEKYAEFKLSIVGPLVSFGIAGILYLIRYFSESSNLILFTSWIGSVNFILGVFNLLPAFPMDGGRALRSYLAAKQGLIRATENAVKVSRAFAWILGILGALTFNFLLLLIAFFIYTAATSELALLVNRNRLRGLRAGDVGLRTRVLSEDNSVLQGVEQMLQGRVPVLPVQTRSERSAVVSLAALRTIPRERWSSTLTRDVMEEVPCALDVNDSLDQAFPELVATASAALPLVESGRVVGVVRVSDLEDVVLLKSIRENLPLREKEEERKKAA